MKSVKKQWGYTYWYGRKIKRTTYTLEICEDGTIKRNGKKLVQHGCVGDSDLDMIVNVDAFIEVEKNYSHPTHYWVDDLMAKAGFVAGDPSQFSSPVVYHKDGNRLNCSAENLEWCDSSDQKYIDYRNSWKTKK